jgi:hypothetical protein
MKNAIKWMIIGGVLVQAGIAHSMVKFVYLAGSYTYHIAKLTITYGALPI